MPEKQKVLLTAEKETLLITLYAKAMDYHARHSILNDKAAADILASIDADLTKYKGFGNIMTVVRAKQIDEWMTDFIKSVQAAVMLYLGCGLDTRITRINPPPDVDWFDVDFPEVIQVRKTFFSERAGYRMIETSLTDSNWLTEIPRDRPTIIVAEGVLEYLAAGEVRMLLNRLVDHFLHGQIIFDVMNSFAIESGKQKLKDKTGAAHKWAVDDIAEIDRMNPKLIRTAVLPIFKSPYMKKLSPDILLALFFAAFIPQYNNMIRLLRYRF
jgi:O-Methyltransferase involved in polyketide biosynthesis